MFWIREIFGWLLVLVGIYVFYIAMQVLLRENGPFILESPIIVAIGFIIFRGGLQLIKIGVAGRVCVDAQKAALAPPELPRRANPRRKLEPVIETSVRER